jgi:hypothetical protein
MAWTFLYFNYAEELALTDAYSVCFLGWGFLTQHLVKSYYSFKPIVSGLSSQDPNYDGVVLF